MSKLLVLSMLAACSQAINPASQASAPQVYVRSQPRASDTAAALRDEGPAALARLLARWDAMPPSADRDTLADQIDRVAAQRYATASRMFWYTDLAAARAEATRTGKPILSLRMLGRLDEDLSCANSRYFRIALYANAELSQFLRDRFVLHWSSERPAPRITVDFGDGRKLARTITGNSIHYVLDAEGRPVDALPGLYAPQVFKQELERSLVLLASLPAGPERAARLAEAHHRRVRERLAEWNAVAAVAVPISGRVRPAAFAQEVTVTKSGIEMPMYRVVDLGVDVGKLPDDADAWAQLGVRLMPTAAASTTPRYRGTRVQMRSGAGGSAGATAEIAVPLYTVDEVLDASSKALLRRVGPVEWSTGRPTRLTGPQLDGLIERFERDILADTAVNEYSIRPDVHMQFVNHEATFEAMNERIYRDIFHTPASDPWLGLAPEGVTALPADGVIR
ncbi:MAG TPA: hypothetical protein VK427_11480 [Kofleriaceae bacterium]|nr:hypothetical protein [Kofleriaceae bacterium]